MIKRCQYVAYLSSEYASEDIDKAIISSDSEVVKKHISDKDCMTVALYRFRHMLFLYVEKLNEDVTPDMLFPALTEVLDFVPRNEVFTRWTDMTTVYYTSVADSTEEWSRCGKKGRIGRIAVLYPHKLMSYVYYHKAIMDEGLFEGDKYLHIALHDTMLFAYSEEPNEMTHINFECDAPSEVIEEWRRQIPVSHFDHTLTGDGNFLNIDEVFSMGVEDLK